MILYIFTLSGSRSTGLPRRATYDALLSNFTPSYQQGVDLIANYVADFGLTGPSLTKRDLTSRRAAWSFETEESQDWLGDELLEFDQA